MRQSRAAADTSGSVCFGAASASRFCGAPALLITCICMLLAAPAARGQNALQSFLGAMTGPLLPGQAPVPPYDIVIPPGIESVDLQTFQIVGLSSLYGCVKAPSGRWLVGLSAILGADADQVSSVIDTRRAALCTPADDETTHSSVFVAVASTEQLGRQPMAWINIGYSVFRNDPQFSPAFGAAYYVEIKHGPFRQLVDLGPIVLAAGYDSPVLYTVTRGGPYDDEWNYYVAELFEGIELPIASGSVQGSGWQGVAGARVDACAEATAIGNRVPGSFQRPTTFYGPAYRDRSSGGYYFVPTDPVAGGIIYSMNPFGRHKIEDAQTSTFSVWDIR